MGSIVSFITGSHVYGTPRSDSDIDLVVLASVDDMKKLQTLADAGSDKPADEGDHAEGYAPESTSLRFGRLNLLVFQDLEHFAAWRKVNEKLVAGPKPVKRDDAVKAFKAALAEVRKVKAAREKLKKAADEFRKARAAAK